MKEGEKNDDAIFHRIEDERNRVTMIITSRMVAAMIDDVDLIGLI